MSKRKKQILKQKAYGVLGVIGGVLSVPLFEGDLTIPIMIIVAGLICIACNLTGDEIIQKGCQQEIDEDKEDL